MKICPNCRDEFLEHVEICPDCQQKLTTDLSIVQGATAALSSKEELLKGEMMPLIEGSLERCKEIESILKKSLVVSALYPLSLVVKDHLATMGSALGSTSNIPYMVLINPNDEEKARLALASQFHADVAKEGQGELYKTPVNLEEEQITCPACGETGALEQGECVFCGLTLSVDEAHEKKPGMT